MFLLNIIIVISLDSDPASSLSDSYFGYFRPYVTDYFFAEISAILVLINIFLFKKPSSQNKHIEIFIFSSDIWINKFV